MEKEINTIAEIETGKKVAKKQIKHLAENEVGQGEIKKSMSTLAEEEVGKGLIKNHVRTLADLNIEQEKLKMTMVLTRQEFAENLGTNKEQIKEFLLKKVALPVGAVGVGIAAVNKMSSDKKKNKSHTAHTTNLDFLKLLIPVGIGLFQSYFLKQQSEQIEDIAEEQ